MRVLVTGCNSGFGLHTTQLLAQRGDTVYATVRNPDTALELLALRDSGLPIMIERLDVRNAEQAEALVSRIIADGGIDVLVNNAGAGMIGSVEQTSIDQARELMETNFIGPMRLIQLVLPHMRSRRSGRIVNISSGVGFIPLAYLGAYTASKHALDGLSFCLAAELREFGIGVSVIAPGAYNTAIVGKLWQPQGDAGEPRYTQRTNLIIEGMENQTRASDPIVLARAIIEAVDGVSSGIRRFVGNDAEELERVRRRLTDDEWLDQMVAIANPA